MKKLNDNDLDISGGKFEIHGWEYRCSVCGQTWQKHKGLFTSLKSPNAYTECPNCGNKEKAESGVFKNGKTRTIRSEWRWGGYVHGLDECNGWDKYANMK